MIIQAKWIDEYLEECKTEKDLSIHTLKAYRIDLELFKKMMIDNETDLNKESLEAYIEFLYNEYYPKTAKRKLASVRAFVYDLYMKEILAVNPFEKIKVSQRDMRKMPETIDTSIIASIFNSMQKDLQSSKTKYQEQKHLRNLLILDLMISTGIRVSEACNIKHSSLDLSNKSISIDGKGKRGRVLSLRDETVKLIGDYIDSVNCESEYLFQSMEGNKMNEDAIRYMLAHYSKTIDFEYLITPRQLRDTFARLLLDDEVDVRIVQKILGHSNLETTALYSDVAQERVKQALSENNPKSKI